MGVEPTSDRKTCHPPVLKTGTITGLHALPARGNKQTLSRLSKNCGTQDSPLDSGPFLLDSGVSILCVSL